MSRLKVLQLGKFYDPYPGGMETTVKSLCEGLKDRVDFQVLVANTELHTVREVRSIPVTRAASFGTVFSCSVAPTYPLLMRELPGDILHLHVPNPLAEASYVFMREKRPLIVHFHSDVIRQKSVMSVYGPVLRALYDRADRIIVCTPNHIDVSPFVSPHRSKCRVVPQGYDLRSFDLDVAGEKRVQELRSDAPTLIFVGRLVYYKGLDVLLHAMTQLPARLWIVGVGPLEHQSKELAASLQLGDRVDFLGKISDQELLARYHAADMLVLPSTANSEMFGMVQIEAMACRKPVVATKLPTGVSWVNQHGVTGLLAEPGNADDLAKAIQKLIDSPSLRHDMGEAGRRRAEELFTLERFTDGVLSVYEEVMKN